MRYLFLFLTLFLTQSASADPDHSQARAFVQEAVLEQLQLQNGSLTEETRVLLLTLDTDGNPLSFIPDCPICLGVQDALETLAPSEQDENIPQDWADAKPSVRTLSVAKFVRAAVKSKLDMMEDIQAKLAMARRLQEGSEEGQRQLARYQSKKAEAYKMMWSCLMCDAVVKAGK